MLQSSWQMKFEIFEKNAAKWGILVVWIFLGGLPEKRAQFFLGGCDLHRNYGIVVSYIRKISATLRKDEFLLAHSKLKVYQEWVLLLKHLKSKSQFSTNILKFSTNHEDNPFTLNCFMVPCTISFIFDAGLRRLSSNNFRNSSYKEKTPGSACVSRLAFRFVWLLLNKI